MLVSLPKLLLGGATIVFGGLGVAGTALGTKAFLRQDWDSVERYIFQQKQAPTYYYVCNNQENSRYKCGKWSDNQNLKYSRDNTRLHKDLIDWQRSKAQKYAPLNLSTHKACTSGLFFFRNICKSGNNNSSSQEK